MSRLDQHVDAVRGKMALATLVRYWAWAGIALCAAILLMVLLGRLFQVHLPRSIIWFWAALGAAIVVPIVLTALRRPTARQAAVAIDERLGLREKFSTALYVRRSADPFAAAAVRDAEKTAESVSLHKQFPIPYPARPANAMFGAAAITLAVFCWFPQFDLAGVQQRQVQKVEQRRHAEQVALRAVKDAIAEVETAPREVAQDEKIKLAMQDLKNFLNQPAIDAPKAAKKAQDTLKEIAAVKEKIKNAGQYAKAQSELEDLKNVAPPSPEETGPVADAQRALAQGNLDAAVDKLQDAVKNFDKMNKKEQEKAAGQMKKLANQIAKQAQNPQNQQKLQQQLQQAGVDKQTAQAMTQAMQQAANGNPQAQQQLQNMMNKAIQQANQQSGQSQAQQKAVAQAIRKAVQQGQQQANGQASAQQMAQAAKGLAQAMQQAASGQGKQGGQQGSQQAKAGNSPGQKGQNGQQGNSPGGQSAQQQMQQQIAQMQAMAKDAQAVAAGQQGGQPGGQNQQPGGGNKAGQQAGQFGNAAGGKWQAGVPKPQQGPGGQGGPGIAAGGRRPDPTVAPFAVKQELSQSQTNDKGKVIASTFIKAPADRGESKIEFSRALESAKQDAADEVHNERIPRSAQQAVKDYFATMANDPPTK